MASSEEPCEAEEHAVEEHDLQEQVEQEQVLNNPRRSRESMSPGSGSKLIVGNLELVGPFRQEGQGVHLRTAG
jgi:hypothetical protein